MKIIKVEKQIRQAFSNNDLEKLMSLPNFDFNSKELNLYLGNLRIVLGQIISTLNSFSSIYKSYMDGRDISNSNVNNLINDIKNLDVIKTKLSEIENNLNTYSQNDPEFIKYNNLARVVRNQIQYIKNSSFNENQLKNIMEMATGSKSQKTKRVEEINIERMNQFLNSSIYSVSDGGKKTLRVIREVLQNACDAVNKKHKTGGEINIYTNEMSQIDKNGNQLKSMDLIFEDNGVGMDWNTLSNKFFVYFSSGKGDDQNATGGFGIAKALIQETPKEGWSLETNDIHSSKFNKNMFFADQENYQHPRLEESPLGGLRLTLYDIPRVSEYEITGLASKYSSISTLLIKVNNGAVQPLFTLDSLKKIDSINSNETIANVLGDNKAEKDMISNNLGNLIKETIGTLTFDENNTKTTIEFFMNRKNESSYRWGNFYIFLNGQYQFEKNPYPYLQRFDIICSINTNARPGSEEYPVDPGRENVKEPYKTRINEIESEFKEAVNKIFQDELFKEGLDVEIYNKDKGGIEFEDNEQIRTSLEAAIQAVDIQPKRPDQPNQQEQQEQQTKEEKAQQITEIIEKTIEEKQNRQLDSSQEDIITKMVNNAVNERDEKIDIKELIDNIMQGINNQFAIIIQKGYISKERVQNKRIITSNLIVTWNDTLKILGNRIIKSTMRRHLEGKNIVGGIIYSNEALGLSMPPKGDRDNYITLINPINSAAIIETDMFQSQLVNLHNQNENEVADTTSDIKDETPINKFTNFIYHLAVHELTHDMFPGGMTIEDFHKNITFVEMICQSEYNKVRDIVKDMMPKLRRDMKQLITMVKKEKQSALEQLDANQSIKLKKNSFNLFKRINKS